MTWFMWFIVMLPFILLGAIIVGMILISMIDHSESSPLQTSASLECYHCGQQTSSSKRTCRHCGGELQ